jgi:hypothetical protein
MPGYVQILGAMPGTNQEIADRTSLSVQTVAKLTREFHQLRIIHRSASVKGKPHSSDVSMWTAGPGESVKINRPEPTDRPRSQAIAFAHVIRCLYEPSTVTEIHEETGIYPSVIRKIIKQMRQHKICRVREWERRHGCPIARHQWGKGQDIPKPRPLTRQEINAKWNPRMHAKRVMRRIISATAGVMQQAA